MERRVKIFRVGQTEVLDWFRCAAEGWPQQVAMPLLKGLPKGFRVLAVQSDFAYRVFNFLVEHESFEPLAEGTIVPVVPELLSAEYVAFSLATHTQE